MFSSPKSPLRGQLSAEKEQNLKVCVCVCMGGGVCGKEWRRGGLEGDYSQVQSCACHIVFLLEEAALVLEAWESDLVAG